MKKIDLLAVLDALECAEAEFEQLILDEDWYVTDITDRITDAKARVVEALSPEKPEPQSEEEWECG